ncbi:AAA family ATPase [Chenggangzhangella methanolivorans]|uniref:AAA family ATPase n=1 Tax=Chenggangzhangella methanolivorans TaxID=1437009 RepID=A0A9E6R972_9HYPH|nr:AAA family ATPase [Chenggangzhangella methanolivorans]QZN99138.1 AAA family ATPase [Chenggangzhangella methanolivorans]
MARWRRIAMSLSAPVAADRTPVLEDLAGYGEAKSRLLAIAEDIRRVRDGKLSGAELPSLLLHGRPGTGKTMLARSLSKSVGLPLVQTSIGDWFSGERAHLGTVIGQARQFFERAASAAPCIALIDELDALPDRMHLEARDREWWTPIITMVLLSIDRLRATSRGVVLIGATNHYRHLDEALVRPGRFDNHLELSGPTTEQDFAEILRQHLNSALPDADLSGVARAALARGATGAVVESWVRAARERARSNARDLILADLVEQATPSPDRSPEKELAIALHEASHAVVGRILGFKVRSVTLVRQGAVAGKASFTEDDAPTTKAQIESHIVCGLAGRAGDELLNGAAEGGAIGDLHTATGLVAATHAAYGLQGRLSSVGSIEDAVVALRFDRSLAGKVEADLQRLMGEARRLVALHRGAIQCLARTLVANRVITQTEVDDAIAADPASRAAAVWGRIVERVTEGGQDSDGAGEQPDALQGPALPEGGR